MSPAFIPPEEAVKLVTEEGAVILDVRTKEEHENEHIKNSVNIPLDVLGESAEKRIPDTAGKIIVHCKSGGRSSAAKQLLDSLGYENVFNLGGIKNWPQETKGTKAGSQSALQCLWQNLTHRPER